MRIALVMPHSVGSGDSGDRLRTLTLTERLSAHGLDPVVLHPVFPSLGGRAVRQTPTDDASRPFQVGSASVPAAVGWRLSLQLRRRSDPLALFSSPSYERALAAALESVAPDVVDFQHTFTWVPTRFPSVCTVHNVEALSSARGLTARQQRNVAARERRALLGATQVVALSELDRERIRQIADPPQEPKIVPIGLTEGRQEHVVREHMRVIAFVGSYDYEPNRRAVRWLLDWWPTASAGLGLERLVVIGRQAAQLGIDMAGVEVRSDVPDVGEALRDVDALIVPVDTGGGVRVKIIEAMGRGLPVATTRLGCEGLGLRDGDTAMIAEDSAHLPEALARLAPLAVRQGVSERALAHWRAHFSAEAMAQGMTQVYRCTLEHGTG